MKTLLITGVSGFIGANLAEKLLSTVPDIKIIGVDNMNDYYDVSLKEYRLKKLLNFPAFSFVKENIANKEAIRRIFEDNIPDIVINLAAQAGVRYSLTNPEAYVESNLIGFFNILEACRHSYDDGEKGVEHLLYASSSSVYGNNTKVPYSVEDKTDQPVSLYAATKKSDELMAYAYSKLYGIPATGLRFFTVYGPAGRPDMAYFSFTNKMVNGEKIQIYNYGDMYRDFTYIDDIVEAIVKIIPCPPEKHVSQVCHHVYNIGNHKPESLLDFVNILERSLIEAKIIDKPVEKELLPMQPGDVYQTYADVSELEKKFGYKPSTSLEDGLRQFAKWYKKFYRSIS